MAGSALLVRLREEHDALTKRLRTASLVILSALLVLGLTVAKAQSQLEGQELKERLDAIRELTSKLDRTPEISSLLKARMARGKETAEPLPELSSEERSLAEAELTRLEAELEEKARAWFTVEFDVLGSKFEFDVRGWIGWFPILFGVGVLQLLVTAIQRRAIRETGRQLWHQAPPTAEDDVPERLLFGGGSGYTRLPLRLEGLGFVLVTAVLAAWILRFVFAVWLADEQDPRLIGEMLAYEVLVVVGLTLFFEKYLAIQMREAFGVGVRLSPLGRLGAWFAAIGRGVLERLRRWPRRSLTATGLLVLLSLPLAIAEDCDGVKSTGWELLVEGKTAWQMTEGLYQTNAYHRTVDRVLYGLAILLVPIGLLVVGARTRGWFERRAAWLIAAVPRVAAVTLVYFLQDWLVPLGVAGLMATFGALGQSDPVGTLAFGQLVVLTRFSWILPALWLLARGWRRPRWAWLDGGERYLLPALAVPTLALGLFHIFWANPDLPGYQSFSLGFPLFALILLGQDLARSP